MTRTVTTSPDILFKQESYQLIGACFEVYNHMGSGFLEPVYQECLEIELGLQSIPFTPQRKLLLSYKDRELKATYKPDFFCFDNIIVEIKALKEFTGKHRSQVLNYLKATNLQLGLLVNFGDPADLKYERIIRYQD